MAVTITETKRLPVRRDKQISTSGAVVSAGGGGESSDYGTTLSHYDVGVSGFTDGSAAYPSIFFSGDTNTGFYRPLGDTIGVSVGGGETARFNSDGSFYVKDDIVGFSALYSDKRLKDNIENIKDGLSTILKLKPIKYNYIPNNTKHYGMIAQEIENIIPEIVVEHKLLSDDDTKYKTIRYQEIIPWLVKAIQEQQKQIHQLEQDLNYYKNSLY